MALFQYLGISCIDAFVIKHNKLGGVWLPKQTGAFVKEMWGEPLETF